MFNYEVVKGVMSRAPPPHATEGGNQHAPRAAWVSFGAEQSFGRLLEVHVYAAGAATFNDRIQEYRPFLTPQSFLIKATERKSKGKYTERNRRAGLKGLENP